MRIGIGMGMGGNGDGGGGGDTQERFARMITLDTAEQTFVNLADQIAAPTTISTDSDLLVFDIVFPASWGGGNVTVSGPDLDGNAQTDTIVYAGTGRAHGSKVFCGCVATDITAIATLDGGGAHNAQIQARNVLCMPQGDITEFTSIKRLDTDEVFTQGATDLVNGWIEPSGGTVALGGYYLVGYR